MNLARDASILIQVSLQKVITYEELYRADLRVFCRQEDLPPLQGLVDVNLTDLLRRSMPLPRGLHVQI